MEIQVYPYPYPSAHPCTPVQLIQPYSSTAYLHVVPSYHSSLSRYQRTTHRSPPPSGYGYTAHPCLRTSTSTTTGRWEMGDGKWECGNGEFGCLLGRGERGAMGSGDGERRWGGETRRWFLMQWWKGGCWRGECVCLALCVWGRECVCVQFDGCSGCGCGGGGYSGCGAGGLSPTQTRAAASSPSWMDFSPPPILPGATHPPSPSAVASTILSCPAANTILAMGRRVVRVVGSC